MALARWTPMGNLQSFQEEMNRMFHDFFRGGEGGDQGWASGTWTPPVDIYETEDALVLTAMLPGVSKDDVTIEVHNNTLTLRGERKLDKEVKQDNYHRVERSYGAFSRSFTLPSVVDQGSIKAEYRDGVLKLTLPKREEAKPRQIQINVG